MAYFLDQITTILTTVPGNLTYHLVLAFAIAGTFPAALTLRRKADFPAGGRLLFGLSLLLVVRMIQFLLAGAAWQGLVNGHLLLPPLDRAVTLLGMLVIVWLWAFPHPLRLADAAIVLLTLLGITLSALTYVWWTEQSATPAYNGAFADLVAQGAALAFGVIGVLILLIRRPTGWAIGIAMLVVLSLGHAAQLWFAPPQGDFPGIVRLAQMLAYPLLLALPQRLATTREGPPTVDTGRIAASRRQLPATDIPLLESYIALGSSASRGEICQALVRTIAHTWLADFCLLLTPPNEQGQMHVACAYDLIREDWSELPPLDTAGVPALLAALNEKQILHLPSSRDAADLYTFAGLLNLTRSGPLLAAPVYADNDRLLACLVLLTPHTMRSWSEEDRQSLRQIAGGVALLLQRSEVYVALERELEQAHHTLQDNRQEIERFQQEVQDLQEQLRTTQERDRQARMQAESLAAVIASYEEAEATITGLRAELDQLRSQASAEEEQAAALETSGEDDNHQNSGELRLALEEIARLRLALSELEGRQPASTQDGSPAGGIPISVDTAEITALVQQLRQPMSSILGYTEILLSETLGILGNKQRKFLEKVRIATERLTSLADHLARLTSSGHALPNQEITDVDLNAVVDEAIACASAQLRQKNITLQVDLPERLPQLQSDYPALQQVLVHLLENAGQVTPDGGEIKLRAHLQENNREQDYVLLQVSDQGGGIPAEEVPQLFSIATSEVPGGSEDQPAEQPSEETDSDHQRLPRVKSLVERLGGRIWVDSEPGAGATFSVLLPIVASEPPSADLEGLLA